MRSTKLLQSRLILTCILLLGGFLPPSPNSLPGGIGRAMAQQQQQQLPEVQETRQGIVDKEDKDKEEDKGKEDIEADTPPPVPLPTSPPLETPPPTASPTVILTPVPTPTPSVSPTPRNPLEEVALPKILIDVKTTSGMEIGTCDSFFHDFVDHLLTSSRAISPSSLNATILDISMESLGGEEEEFPGAEFSKGAEGGESTSNVRILVDGMVYYYPVTNPAKDYNSTDLKESMSHSMTVYLTLWGPGDLENELKKCGIVNPQVMAVSVDGIAVTLPDRDDDRDETPVGVVAKVSDPDAATWSNTKLVATSLAFVVAVLML